MGQGSAAEGAPLQLKSDSDDGDDLESCFEESSTALGCLDIASKGAMNSESTIAADVDLNYWSEEEVVVPDPAMVSCDLHGNNRECMHVDE